MTNGGTGTSFRQTTFPFGTKIAAETTGNSDQVFTSYYRSSSGLDYAVNRTYSPGQSRFTQVDPIGMASASLGNPQSNNLYAYVQNMPTDFVDPSGLRLQYYDIRRGLGCVVVNGVNRCIEYIDRYWYDDGTDSDGGWGVSDSGVAGGGGSSSQQAPDVSPDCVAALKKLGVWNQVQRLLTSAKRYDVDELFDLSASDYVGKNSGYLFLGDWFNGRSHGGNGATVIRGAGRREGIYYRSSVGMSDDTLLHEVTHLAYPRVIPAGNNQSLDELLGKALGLRQRQRQDGTGNETWSQAVNRFFDAKCNPAQLN